MKHIYTDILFDYYIISGNTFQPDLFKKYIGLSCPVIKAKSSACIKNLLVQFSIKAKVFAEPNSK